MDTSFELQSSMSPRVLPNFTIIRKAPSTLALKRYFRKSLTMSKNKKNLEESIITVASSSSEEANNSPVIISDSESSTDMNKVKTLKFNRKSAALTSDKYSTIQQWVNQVNHATEDLSVYSEKSTILEEDNPRFKKPDTNFAASSTFVLDGGTRFDQLFKKKPQPLKDNASLNCNNDVLSDSLISSDSELENKPNNVNVEDSFELELSDDSFTTRIKEKLNRDRAKAKLSESPKLSEYKGVLGDLYANVWREKVDEILPSSEPKLKHHRPVPKQVPNTERCPKKQPDLHKLDANLLKTVQRQSIKKPWWSESLKKLCDSESEDEQRNVLHPLKLDFDEDDDKFKSSDTDSDSDWAEKRRNVDKSRGKENKARQKLPKPQKAAKNAAQTFLSSLSGNVPEEECEIQALIYRKNFQLHKEALVKKLFELFNDKVFDGAIPENTEFEWRCRLRGTAGLCICKKITRRTGKVERSVKICLATKVLDSADRVRDTLIHEMCHAATWIVNGVSDGHGPFWKSWAARAMSVFPELPPIKRCHSYVINTKYTYRCTGCGYSIGRHSKSLNTDKKRCGYCYGTFELLINKTTKKGETKAVPSTPRKPSKFALFIKENYADYKTPELKHGEVMRFLGQKFADLKVAKTQ